MSALEQLSADVIDFTTTVIRVELGPSAQKVAHEAIEFAEHPSLEEAADVLITVLSWLHQAGHTPAEWVAAADAKMARNRARSWEQLPDGTFQHV